jgi:hypothetical protein
MSWQLHAHWFDKKAHGGVGETPVAELDLGRGGGLLPELLELKAPGPNPRLAVEAGTKVSKAKVENALCECCKRYLAGEDLIWELHFLSTLLKNWKASQNSIFILMS